MKKRANRKLRHKLAHPRHKNCSRKLLMAIFVFSTEKPMEIAANMNEQLKNVVLVASLVYINISGPQTTTRIEVRVAHL